MERHTATTPRKWTVIHPGIFSFKKINQFADFVSRILIAESIILIGDH